MASNALATRRATYHLLLPCSPWHWKTGPLYWTISLLLTLSTVRLYFKTLSACLHRIHTINETRILTTASASWFPPRMHPCQRYVRYQTSMQRKQQKLQTVDLPRLPAPLLLAAKRHGEGPAWPRSRLISVRHAVRRANGREQQWQNSKQTPRPAHDYLGRSSAMNTALSIRTD